MTDLAAMVQKTATTASKMEAPIGIIAGRTSQWQGRVCAQQAQPHLVQAETAGVSLAVFSLFSLFSAAGSWIAVGPPGACL